MYDYLKRVCFAGVFVLCCVLLFLQLQAQTIGRAAAISGRVLDPANTAIPGATVTIKSELSGVVTAPGHRISKLAGRNVTASITFELSPKKLKEKSAARDT